MPTDLELIIQGMAVIPTENQPMDDDEPLQYFTLAPPTLPPPIQINLAEAKGANEDEEDNKAAKGSLKGSPLTKFNRDRKMAKKFLNDFKTYKFLNRKNETMCHRRDFRL